LNHLTPTPSDTFFTTTFKNDARILTKASDLHNELVEELKAFIPDGDFITQCSFQPLSAIFGQRTVEAGGNMLGLDRQKTNDILFLAVAMVRTPEQDAFARPKVQEWVQSINDFAAAIEGGQRAWRFLCYSDGSQNPLASYGHENVKKMKEVAAKYDPEQVFQKLVPGGFKISKV
jgi:hypothetical protein